MERGGDFTEDCIGRGEVKIPCEWASLARKATENPVSVALHYKKVVYDLMSILVGIKPGTTSGDNNRTVKTEYRGWGEDSLGIIVGTPAAFIGVTETTARGSLHFHVGENNISLFQNVLICSVWPTGVEFRFLVIWGGLSPDLLAKISTYPDLCNEAARVIESMYCASLPRSTHVRDLVNKALPHYYNSSLSFGE